MAAIASLLYAFAMPVSFPAKWFDDLSQGAVPNDSFDLFLTEAEINASGLSES